jgi:quinohemoprotein ethanol dehydrogenase
MCTTHGATGALALIFALAVAPALGAPPRALVAPPTASWPTNGGNWFNQRYSPLTAINRDNVAKLKGVWRARLDGSGLGARFSNAAQPLVVDGVVYVSTGANDVFALDVDTGKTLWSYQANLVDVTTVCCSWTSRGVAFGAGLVFEGQLDGKIVALDAKTGSLVWSIQAERWEEGFTITSAPLYFDGLLISGFTGAERGVRGRVKAFDAKNGKLVWTFYVVPAPGERGSETWPKNDVWQDGGGTVWQTPAVDPELGLVFFSTSNPGPDFNGAVRAGDNLFTSSIMALDAKTGAYRWHFQQVHHDLWDYDSGNPVVLFDLAIDGKTRRGIAEASKSGWVYILDRTTGKPLIGIDEKPVAQEPRQLTSPTQPIPRGDAFVPQSMEIAPEGFTLVNGGRVFTPYWTDYVIAKPGIGGGANWPPSSYDPETHLFYVCAHDGIGAYTSNGETSLTQPTPGGRYLNGTYVRSGIRVRGVFAAVDLTTNKLAWRQQWNEMCYSGSIVTKGGLVFVGRNDSRFTALDKTNGRLLWDFQMDAAVNATASTFEHDGKQYVVVLAAGSFFPGTKHGDSLWLFTLDGQFQPTPSTAGAADSSAPATVLTH